jgi:hypothetical protein
MELQEIAAQKLEVPIAAFRFLKATTRVRLEAPHSNK